MGIDVNGSRLLLYARALGVSFARTATIGRQGLHLRPGQLRRNLAAFRLPTTAAEADQLLGQDGYAEGFFRKLGAAEVVSFDASDYEGATHVHDFNVPIPEQFKGQFTSVVDGGSLEHIFNFPAAIKNCMEMVRPGHHFVGITPTNNFSGHGFYQFSPELYFRVFSAANGFQVVKLVVFESHATARWYEVANPEVVQQRVTFVNTRRSYLGVIARRVQDTPIFRSIPQQSDYLAQWTLGRSGSPRCGSQAGTLLRHLLRSARASLDGIRCLSGLMPFRQRKSGLAGRPQFFRELHPCAPGPRA